jgi:serine/threonine protein kinase
MIGQTISHYRIREKIGAGGMAEVYLAEDVNLDRKVALKILPPELAKDEDRLRRFEQEAKAASALNHPNILTIYEIGQSDNLHFIAGEYIKGENLRERLGRGALRFGEVIEVALQVADALAVAHKAGIVHRDVKPENIMLREDGVVKVVDFGVAKLTDRTTKIDCEDPTLRKTSPDTIVGTVAYISPEQLEGKGIDARADVWSLGVCLYEMLARRLPFLQETLCATAAAVLRDEFTPLDEDVPAELRRIVGKALQKEPDNRYQTVKDLWLDLKALRDDLKFAKAARPKSQQAPKATAAIWHRRTKLARPIAVVSLAILIVLVIVGVPYYRHRQALRHIELGRSYWSLRTGDNLRKAEAHFKRALEFEPNNAAAHSDLADTYVLMEEYLGGPTRETIPLAEFHNRRALEIDDSLAETHISRAFILTKLWQWKEAEKEFERGIELKPKYTKGRQWFNVYLRIVGRYDESLTQGKIGKDNDPSDRLIRVNTMISYLAMGDADKAVKEGEELLKLYPDFWGGRVWVGVARLGKGPEAVKDAISDLEAGVSHSQDSHTLIANLGFGYAISGNTEKAHEQIRRLKELYDQQKATGQDLAKVYAGLGHNDEAFMWLEEDYKVRSGDLPHISWHPAFKSLQGDPRFNDLVRRMGLEPRTDNETPKPAAIQAELTGRRKGNAQFSGGAP